MTIRIVHVQVGQDPEIKEVNDTLDQYRELVRTGAKEGWIQTVSLGQDYLMICHDEGKLIPLPDNRFAFTTAGTPIDMIAGDFFIVHKKEEDFESLTERKAALLVDWIKNNWPKADQFEEREYHVNR